MILRIQSLVLDQRRRLELVTHAVLLAQHDQSGRPPFASGRVSSSSMAAGKQLRR